MSALGAKLKSIFTEFNSNKDHVIPREKLLNILKQLDPTWTQDELDTLFEIADQDGNGVIDYDEFVDFICFMDEDPDGKALPEVSSGNAKKLGHQRYSVLSEEALKALEATQDDIASIEARLAEVIKLLKGPEARNLDAAALASLKTEMALMESKANKLETNGVDTVYTSDLTSGKAEAKDQKKQQLNRLEALFGKFEDVFAIIKEGLFKIADEDGNCVIVVDGKGMNEEKALPDVSSGNAKKLGHQRYSVLSEEALTALEATQDDIASIEARIAEVIELLNGSEARNLDAAALASLKTEMALMESKANKLETNGVDTVYTSDLTSGKAEAKDQKKQQLHRLEALFGKFENVFAIIKERQAVVQ